MKWKFIEKLMVIVAVLRIKLFKMSVYSQVKWLQSVMYYRSWESIRSKLNRMRGIKK